MDPFAQSRADDDLFADEFEPITETPPIELQPAPVQIQQPPPHTASIPAGLAKPSQHSGAPRSRPDRRGRGGGRGGRGGTYQNGMGNSRFATPQETKPQTAATVEVATTEKPEPAAIEESPVPDPDTTTNEPQVNVEQQTPPQPDQPHRTPAVRGDRSATGGPTHKKLTEEELSAKMAQMAIINAKRAESHRASEADQAAFQHREKELEKERKERAVAERKNERVMEMERAKNRERKMKAQGGREWDSEKKEEDIVDRRGRSSEFVRGGFGGIARGGGLGGSRYAVQEEGEQGGGELQNGRGGYEGRGRGRGRGGREGGAKGGKASTQTVPTAEDFPALSSASTNVVPAGGDWADEMATPVEEKKVVVESSS